MTATDTVQTTTVQTTPVKKHHHKGLKITLGSIAAAVALAGLGAGLFLGLHSTPPTAAGILHSDGYATSLTLDHKGLTGMLGSDNAQDGKLAATMFESGVVGTKDGGQQTEVVIKMTPEGKAMFSSKFMQNELAKGVGQHAAVHEVGDFMVISGPTG